MEALNRKVIGQHRAKKILSVAVYNHYKKVKLNALNKHRNRVAKSYLENHIYSNPLDKKLNITAKDSSLSKRERNKDDPEDLFREYPILDKSNILILGPTGSGKTLLAKTVAEILDVPFSMSDATPLTQAGYVGEDVESVIHRLLMNCGFDVSLAERGIVFIDEIDKIAKRTDVNSNSKDVSGEGVQQGLLRMLEGTTITITDKNAQLGLQNRFSSFSDLKNMDFKNSFFQKAFNPDSLNDSDSKKQQFENKPGQQSGENNKRNDPNQSTDNSKLYLENNWVQSLGPAASKIGNDRFNFSSRPSDSYFPSKYSMMDSENRNGVFHVDTSNILFILSGAFNGLEKYVLNRVAKSSIGFNNPIRNASSPSDHSSYTEFKKFFTPNQYELEKTIFNSIPNSNDKYNQYQFSSFNPLDYVEPEDLINFGLIPEFVGRLPVTACVNELTLQELTRILTEPKNSIVSQYQELFAMNNVQLVFTKSALNEIALNSKKRKTGARGLRGIIESVLLDPMYDCPSSDFKYVVVTRSAVNFNERCIFLHKGEFDKVNQTCYHF
ncbi:hypothetical protein BB560_001555 [Smittium megazygosporum]|uniref:AAA+ ATPase domain-containing protein n=1 Tax=Smittium megazygosporum TaxID=133381 RepID=A0A2T9ZH97_9FUNG|nr:hypothetical protein BB560_001555 [Smittium megazygosporum]